MCNILHISRSAFKESDFLSFRFVNITIAIYGAVSEMFDHGFGFSFKEMGLLVDATYCSILLFVFCDCSHKSTLTVCNQIRKKHAHNVCSPFSFFFCYFVVAVLYISNYDYTPFHRFELRLIRILSHTHTQPQIVQIKFHSEIELLMFCEKNRHSKNRDKLINRCHYHRRKNTHTQTHIQHPIEHLICVCIHHKIMHMPKCRSYKVAQLSIYRNIRDDGRAMHTILSWANFTDADHFL